MLMFQFQAPMTLNIILATAFEQIILKIVMFILLCFGSLLWPISIVAVMWGFFDGFIPALNKREYEKAAVILFILLITCVVIVISLYEAVYLTGFIIPVILVYIYIKRYIHLPRTTLNDFRNN